MSRIAQLKAYAPGIAVAVIFTTFLILEYVVLPARRAAQEQALAQKAAASQPAATPPGPEASPQQAAPAVPSMPAEPPAAPPTVPPTAPPAAPPAEPPAAPPPAPQESLLPIAPQPVVSATTWSTYRGGQDLSGYIDLDISQRPTVRWQVLVEGKISQPPVADAGGLYACTNEGKVTAWDFAGQPRWSQLLLTADGTKPERVEAPMACHGDTLVVSTLSGRVHALNTATGETRWVYEVGSEVLGGAVLHAGSSPGEASRLYVVQRENGTLHAIDFATGQGLAKGAAISRTDGSPALANGLVVFGSCDFAVHVHDAAQGTHLKNIRLCDDCQVAGGPAVLGDFAYTGSRVGFFYCVNVRTGGIAWTNQDCVEEVFTTPAVSLDTVVFSAEDGQVYALDRATGRTKWKHDTGGLPTSAVIARDTVLVSVDGALQALALQDGTPRWSHEVSDHIAAPAIISGMVVIGSEDGTLVALAPGGASS